MHLPKIDLLLVVVFFLLLGAAEDLHSFLI